MADASNGQTYRAARQVLALLFGGTAAVIALASHFGLGPSVDPFVFGGLLVAAAGLLAVDLPLLRR